MVDKDKNQQDSQKLIDKIKEQMKQRGQEASLTRKIVTIILIVLTIIIVVGSFSGFMYIKSAIEPVDVEDDTTKIVEIPLGSSTSEIGQILEENNIINNSTVFRFFIKFKNVSQFQAGDYNLSPSMTLTEITDILQTGTIMREPVLTVTIPEGKTIEQMAGLFSEKANVDQEAFIETIQDETFIQTMINQYPSILSDEILNPDIIYPLEGYLFAATYDFYEEEPSVEVIITKMLDKTEDVLNSYLNQIAERGWTVHEIVTMSSLVEKEAPNEDDRKQIAGVFYNRLESDMLLQTDPTVAYAKGEHLERTLISDTEIDSPYNTYQYVGLPIGPISNFGESSLQAVLEPEETEYYYFLAADGEVYYSRTNEEHNQKRAQYLN